MEEEFLCLLTRSFCCGLMRVTISELFQWKKAEMLNPFSIDFPEELKLLRKTWRKLLVKAKFSWNTLTTVRLLLVLRIWEQEWGDPFTFCCLNWSSQWDRRNWMKLPEGSIVRWEDLWENTQRLLTGLMFLIGDDWVSANGSWCRICLKPLIILVKWRTSRNECFIIISYFVVLFQNIYYSNKF